MDLKSIRTQQNLTQKQLAEKMNTTQQTVARWENGKTPLNAEHIKQLCGILQCTAQELLGWELEEDAFDSSMLSEHGEPYGSLKLRMAFGMVDVPIGTNAMDAVDGFLNRHGILNGAKESSEMLVVPTLTMRLLLVNPASLRSVSIVSDEIEAMPGYDDSEDEVLVEDDASFGDDLRSPVPLDEALRVTFTDGSQEDYHLSQRVADEVYAILVGNDVHDGCFLMVEEEESGHLRTYLDMGEVAMLDLPAPLFAELTGDEYGDADSDQ